MRSAWRALGGDSSDFTASFQADGDQTAQTASGWSEPEPEPMDDDGQSTMDDDGQVGSAQQAGMNMGMPLRRVAHLGSVSADAMLYIAALDRPVIMVGN